jgi:hypothetical protein
VNDPFAKKMKDLGFELPHWCEPPSDELIAQFEKRFRVSLPADYREFLLRHGGKVSSGGNVVCPVQEPTPFGTEACIDSFYGFGPPERADNITWATELIDGAPSVIAIGSDLMGNMIWLKCDGRDAGYVYQHDHEGRSAWTDEMFYEMFPNLGGEVQQYLQLRKQGKLPRKPRGYEHVYRLGRSFTEFMDALKTGPDESDEEIPPEKDPDRIPKALARCDETILQELRGSGKLNEEVYYGQTPLQIVAAIGNMEALEWLLNAGAQIANGALCSAARNCRADVVRFLLEKGCDTNERWRGMTPLMHVVEVVDDLDAHLEIVRILIEHGADVNAISDEGESVLGIAGGDRYSTGRTKGPPKIVAFLKTAGAELNRR